MAARVWNELPSHITSAASLRFLWQSSEDSTFSTVPFPTFCSACEVEDDTVMEKSGDTAVTKAVTAGMGKTSR